MEIYEASLGNTSRLENNLEKELTKILVKDIMSKQLIIAPFHTTLHQISKMMEQGIGAVLVKKDSIIVGIITARDFAIKIAANKFSLDTPVGKIASIPLEKIGPNQTILDVANQMSTKQIRKIAVVEDSKVIGIISSGDLVDQLSLIKKKIEI